jgi:sugar fermentation stimulation protein A
MQYHTTVQGTFLERPNRFIAIVETAEGAQICHVKNTGRCRELLVPGATVYLERAENPARKTAYDLIAVQKGARLINMDAQAPNRVFGEWAAAGGFLSDIREIRPEYVYGASRLDFSLMTEGGQHLVEVKGVTLEEDGRARFPDAPTERGVKHLHELRRAAEEGLQATLFFVVQMKGVESVAPNDMTHPAFGDALREAAEAGVHIAAWDCAVTPDSILIDSPVPVLLRP